MMLNLKVSMHNLVTSLLNGLDELHQYFDTLLAPVDAISTDPQYVMGIQALKKLSQTAQSGKTSIQQC